jgi:hypothetical protein
VYSDRHRCTDCDSHLSLGDDPLLFPGMTPTGLLSLLWTLGRKFRGLASYPISSRGMLFEWDVVCYEGVEGGGFKRDERRGEEGVVCDVQSFIY